MDESGAVIVGPGRMGQGLALALGASGWGIRLVARSPRAVASSLSLHLGDWADATRGIALVIIATPDDAIPDVARELAARGAIAAEHVVLHLSGGLDRSALAPLEKTGAGLGSFHPLQTIADPDTAAARFRGAFAGIEGDERALAAGERLAHALEMTAVRVTAQGKARYHAGGVIAANYVVALAGVASRLAIEAGIPAPVAARMYLPLIAGAVSNLTQLGPAAALTGPIRRADLRTIRGHLAALAPDDRSLYRALGRAALRLAREAGLAERDAREVERLLADGEPPGGDERLADGERRDDDGS